MAIQVCVVLAVALAMFGTGALAKPGYASPYEHEVDYYVSSMYLQRIFIQIIASKVIELWTSTAKILFKYIKQKQQW